MAVIGTAATREAPYPSGLKNIGAASTILSGTGVDSTAVVAAVTSKQIHVIGGELTLSGTTTITFYSDTTAIAVFEQTNAGTIHLLPSDHIYTAAGEALKVDNPDGAQFDLNVITVAVGSNQTIPHTDGM